MFGLLGLVAALASDKPVFRVYTYDSWMSPQGMGSWVEAEFEKQCACDLRLISVGSAAQILARLELDALSGRGPKADAVVGIDELVWAQGAQHFAPWGEWTPEGYQDLVPGVLVDSGFLPVDYGVFAFMADLRWFKKSGVSLPQSLRDLTQTGLRKQILLEDPRTSAPGLAFVMMTLEALGNDVETYWKKLSDQWLALTPGWDTAYGRFQRGEAALVWSYTTSQAFHQKKGEQHYRSLTFSEPHPVQVEGAALLKGSLQLELGRRWLSFLLSVPVQQQVWSRQWMMSVRKSVAPPPEWSGVPKPSRWFHLRKTQSQVHEALRRFGMALGRP